MTGLKLNVCGQIGVIAIHGTLGEIKEPPALTLYAVLPVGVLMIKPSAYTVVTYSYTHRHIYPCIQIALHHTRNIT